MVRERHTRSVRVNIARRQSHSTETKRLISLECLREEPLEWLGRDTRCELRNSAGKQAGDQFLATASNPVRRICRHLLAVAERNARPASPVVRCNCYQRVRSLIEGKVERTSRGGWLRARGNVDRSVGPFEILQIVVSQCSRFIENLLTP